MKFRDIFNIMKVNILTKDEWELTNDGRVKCLPSAKLKLKKILEIPVFNEYSSNLEKTFFSNDITDYTRNNIKEGCNNVITIINLSNMYLRNFEELYPELDEYSISVKLPDNNDIGEMGKTYSELDKILNQVLSYPEITSNVKISNFDNGSYWLDITLGSLAAVKIVSYLTHAAAYIYKKRIEIKLNETDYDKAKLEKNHMEIIVNANEKLLNMYIEKEARNLIDNNYSESKEDKELMMRVMTSVERLSALIEKGAEIRPALEVSDEIKDEFPDLRYLENLISKVKEIENNISKS